MIGVDRLILLLLCYNDSKVLGDLNSGKRARQNRNNCRKLAKKVC